MRTGLAGGVRTVPPPPEAPDEATRTQAERRNAPHHTARAAMTWGLRSLLVSIALVIVWIWLHGGNLTAVHRPADLLTSIGRLSGLFGASLMLLQILLLARMRQDSERSQARERVSLRWVSSDRAYAACSSAHTAPQRSWNKRRWSAKETTSFMCWR